MDTFDSGFIKHYHTFPTGTQRKVTDVFLKEERANHLLPDDATAICQDGNMAVSRTATSQSDSLSYFVADLIDLDGLDSYIDNYHGESGAVTATTSTGSGGHVGDVRRGLNTVTKGRQF